MSKRNNERCDASTESILSGWWSKRDVDVCGQEASGVSLVLRTGESAARERPEVWQDERDARADSILSERDCCLRRRLVVPVAKFASTLYRRTRRLHCTRCW